MSQNRRGHDPYAPHPAAAKVDPLIGETAATSTATPNLNADEMSKAELIEQAYRLGLPVYGTKADIAGRIREAGR